MYYPVPILDNYCLLLHQIFFFFCGIAIACYWYVSIAMFFSCIAIIMNFVISNKTKKSKAVLTSRLRFEIVTYCPQPAVLHLPCPVELLNKRGSELNHVSHLAQQLYVPKPSDCHMYFSAFRLTSAYEVERFTLSTHHLAPGTDIF